MIKTVEEAVARNGGLLHLLNSAVSAPPVAASSDKAPSAPTSEAPSIGQARGIAQMEEQRRNLDQQRTTAQQELATAREALVSGPPSGKYLHGFQVKEVTDAQAKKTALDEALVELDDRLLIARALLEQMKQGEAREAAIAQLLELADKASGLVVERNQARTATAAALEPLIGQMMEHQRELFALRKTFLHLAEKVAPGIRTTRSMEIAAHYNNPDVGRRRDEAGAFLDELGERGADLRAVLNSWASPDNDAVMSGFDREYQWQDEVSFGGMVDFVLGNILQGQMMRAAQDQAYQATKWRQS